MRALVEQRNMSKYCKLHKDRGHDTTERFQLRDQIEALIQGDTYMSTLAGGSQLVRKMLMLIALWLQPKMCVRATSTTDLLIKSVVSLGGMSLVIQLRQGKTS